MESTAKQKYFVFFILLLPVLLVFVVPTGYGIILGLIYKGDRALINEGIGSAIPYILILNHLLALGVLLLHLKKRKISVAKIGLSKGNLSWKAMGLGVVTGIIIFTILNLLPSLLFSASSKVQATDDSSGLIYFIASITVAPIIEEIIFRGYGVTTLLKRFSPIVSILITAVCFSTLHTFNGIEGMITSLLAGMALGFLFYKTRNVIPVIVAHWVMNFSIGMMYALA